ncbi:hypothetical protein BHM03_00038129 [Ensete ventricosum]|nr:hypothetical protein BHM03_00038129 [Ensete ventricosum]
MTMDPTRNETVKRRRLSRRCSSNPQSMDLAGLRSDGGKASWISVRLRCLSPGQDTGNPLKLSYVASSGRVFLNRVPDETAEPDSTSSGYIYCPSRLYWSAKACYLGGDLRSCRCGFLALSISLSQFQTQEKIYVTWSGVQIRAAARRLWRCPFTFCT